MRYEAHVGIASATVRDVQAMQDVAYLPKPFGMDTALWQVHAMKWTSDIIVAFVQSRAGRA